MAIQISCEVCPKVVLDTEIKVFKSMKLCVECYTKEVAFVNSTPTPAVPENKVIAAQQIDATIQIRQELFNAQTVAILEIKKAIEEDSSIPADKKNFKLYEVLQERVTHFRKVIFEMSEAMLNASTEQRAIQTYMNEMHNKLRAEEREHFRIQSANYQPPIVKITKPKATKVKKFDKNELRAEFNKFIEECKAKGLADITAAIKESTIQTICVSRNITPKEALDEMRKNFGIS